MDDTTNSTFVSGFKFLQCATHLDPRKHSMIIITLAKLYAGTLSTRVTLK